MNDQNQTEDREPCLSIRLSNLQQTEPCAICGKRTEATVGPDLFLSGTYQAVCEDCGLKYAPELVETLKSHWRDLRAGMARESGKAAEQADVGRGPASVRPDDQGAADSAPKAIELLLKCLRKPVRRFYQVDGDHLDGPDGLIQPDEDGDAIMSGWSWELRNTGLPIRIMIHDGASKRDVLRLLMKVGIRIENGSLTWLKEGSEDMPF